MTAISLTQAQTNLAEIVRQLAPGEELLITDNDQPIAKLTVVPPQPSSRVPQLGTLRGTVLSMEHFDDPLEEFEEYM